MVIPRLLDMRERTGVRGFPVPRQSVYLIAAGVQEIKGSVQDLPEPECDAYTRQLQMTEGLLSLAANVARMSPDLLAEICKGTESLTARVSKLERLIAKQTTVSQEWKTLQDAHKAADSKKQGERGCSCTLADCCTPPVHQQWGNFDHHFSLLGLEMC